MVNFLNNLSKEARIKRTIRSFCYLILGSILSSFAINIFFTPYMLTMGGLSGIGTIIYQLTGKGDFLPLGLIIGLLNIPLLILGWIKVSFKFVYKSIIGAAFYSFFLTITEKQMADWYTKYFNNQIFGRHPDPLIFCIFGGILFGIAVGLILKGGYTTGGTDILAVILHRRFQSLSLGSIILFLDSAIVTSTIFFYFKIQPNVLVITMYSFIAMYLTTKFMDITLEGLQVGKVAYIISDKQSEIAAQIFETLDRGATGIKARGMYSDAERDMLFCVLSSRQVPKLKEFVKIIDPKAFIIVTDAREVLGEGFEKDTDNFI